MNIEKRDVGIEGISSLYWNSDDIHGFGIKDKDGPIHDWQMSKDAIISSCTNYDVVVQAGGCMGMYPRFYCNYFEQVYTFEPNPTNFEVLSMNLTDKIEAKQCALGLGTEENVDVRLTNKTTNMGACSIIDEKDPGQTLKGNIPVISIDSLNLHKCDLIHLDVEGYEPYCILGAINTIEKFKPVIVLETSVEIPGYTVGRQLRQNLLYLPL